jgi:hypothetical protein
MGVLIDLVLNVSFVVVGFGGRTDLEEEWNNYWCDAIWHAKLLTNFMMAVYVNLGVGKLWVR